MNATQASKRVMRKPTRREYGEGCQRTGSERREHRPVPPGYWRWHADRRERVATREAPPVTWHASTGNPRGPAWAVGVAERPVVLEKPGNAGGGKGPQVRTGEGKSEGLWEWLGLEPRFEFGSAGTTTCESEGDDRGTARKRGTAGGGGEARTGLPSGSSTVGEKTEMCHSRGAGGGSRRAIPAEDESTRVRAAWSHWRARCGKTARRVRGAGRGNAAMVEIEAPA